MAVRVRFAPSPTGYLHVGNIRIAIVNYIYSLQTGGDFLLRIDDTDKTRSTKEYEIAVCEDLAWLGLPHICTGRQSENVAKYDAAFEKLKAQGIVYPCFETPEELNLARKLQLMHKKPPVYNRAALNLSQEEIDKFIGEGKKPYWRFKLREPSSNWEDMILGPDTIALTSISDPVVVKPDGSYVYTFASVVDDINMGITHIIRGSDHVTNTGAQISMFKALGAEIPIFGHIPLLSSADGGDISKRAGSAYSIRQLRENGAEPFAVVAALASLGSSYDYKAGDSMQILVNNFNFHKLSLSAPKFSLDNIYQITGKVVKHYTFEEIAGRLQGLVQCGDNIWLEKFWYCIRENISNMQEAKEWYNICFNDVVEYTTNRPGLAKLLKETLTADITWNDWLKTLKEQSNLSFAELMHEIRLIMTGKTNGPNLGALFEVIGYKRLMQRIK